MGMYTELIFGATLQGLPTHVAEAINYVINDKPENEVSQEALQFANEYELDRIFLGGSYYFGAHRNKPTFVWDGIGDHWVLSTRANCKNYHNQIEKFIEFITPYVESGSGYDHNIFSYVQYEEAEFPTLYGKDGCHNLNDPDRVYAAEEKLNKISNILWPTLDNMIKEYDITEEILAENGLDIKTLTLYDEIILCMKELERRWNQTYDQNYKELQKTISEANRKILDLEIEKDRLEMEVEDYIKQLEKK